MGKGCVAGFAAGSWTTSAGALQAPARRPVIRITIVAIRADSIEARALKRGLLGAAPAGSRAANWCHAAEPLLE
jgi:hypothetical protein